jgi:pimeloyl-ACP methyl ester carboxylesterase
MIEEITGRYLTVRGHRVYLETAGENTGQSIVFIHTAGQHGIQWRFVLPKIAAQGYFAIAPDLPGHGKSLVRDFKPLDTIHGFAETVWEMMGLMELTRPIVVGCSIGGDIALDMAAHHSADLRAVISCEGALRTPTLPLQLINQGLEDSGVPSFGDQGFYGGLSLCGTNADAERVKEITFTRRSGDPKIYYSDLKAWITHDIRSKAKEITCPVLIVWGNEDYIVPYEFVEESANSIPGANLLVLEGSGHYPGTELPNFNEIVEEFISSLKV